jgi:phage gpG-like protein
MIDIQMSGTWPNLNGDLTEAMGEIQALMLASVRENLITGGRPPFHTLSAKYNPLIGSGKMFEGIEGSHDSQSATVFMNDNVRSKGGFFYPAALNFGAEIPPVDGKLMVFEYMGGTVFTTKRKGFKLGPFPFMVFQEEDITQIREKIGSAIFRESGEVIV